jgi:prepilin-type N-terminal cleavage/methylation domain-containing protein
MAMIKHVHVRTERDEDHASSQAGFSLAELLIATTVMLIISGIVTSALLQMSNSQKTIWNRTEMHSGIRSATELLQQEIGQAGLVALPAAVTVSGGGAAATTTMTVTSVTGMFVNELLVVDTGSNKETVTVSTIPSATSITISNSVNNNGVAVQPSFQFTHAIGAPVSVTGGFHTGVIPPAAAPFSYPNGSTATVLKMYGDINGDGNMVYVEYTCDTVGGNLYRNSVAFNAAPPKPALTPALVLLGNIAANPNNTACFQYQTDVIGPTAFVLDVAITLTVNTQQIDPITRQLQTETKALLNISPRNVFNAWELVGQNYASRVQATPASITSLLP